MSPAEANADNARVLEGQNRVLELIARGAPLPRILDLLLHVIQAQCPGMLCSVLLLDPDGLHVRHCSAPDLPDAFIRSVDGEPIGPRAGSCGTAAFRREPVIVEDIATDPLWDDYREGALACGLRASWSTPIFDDQRRVLGTFAMYFRSPGRPAAKHFRLIEVSTHAAAIAIERHREAEALSAAEERLQLALAEGNVDIWEWDIASRRLTMRGPLKPVFGQRPGTHNATPEALLNAVHHEDRQRVENAIEKLLTPGRSEDLEFRISSPDGFLHWIAARGRAECDPAGKALRVTGVAVEITRQKRADEEIRRREGQLAEAQRIANLGSDEWDLRNGSVHRSEELCRIFGVLPEEFESTYEGYLSRVHPDDRGNTQSIIDNSFSDGSPFDFEERIVRPDGSIRALHSQGRWNLDESKRPVKLIGICQDITERKRVERQLRAANEALSEELKERTRAEKEIQALTARLISAQEEERTRLARELHDDLSQQIAVLSIAASNLKRHMGSTDPDAHSQSERIQQKLMQMAGNVRRISHRLHPALLEYAGLAVALESYCSELTALTGLTVSFRSEGSLEFIPPPIALCLYRIGQEALQNVLKHARVSEAQVGLAGCADSVCLTVSDRGVGMSKTARSVPLGIGLFNIQERTRLVKGTVTIDSRPNQGTSLTVTVPIPGPEPEVSDNAPVSSSGP